MTTYRVLHYSKDPLDFETFIDYKIPVQNEIGKPKNSKRKLKNKIAKKLELKPKIIKESANGLFKLSIGFCYSK
jgi:hypothetical protein